MPLHPAAAGGFERAVAAYERGRPSYPAPAVAAAAPPGAGTAIELGAGTGKFTRLLAVHRSRIVAVEPVPAMRARLVEAAPAGASVVAATAEALPLATGVADLVVAAQAFHWFATRVALAEVHRVLAPGGQVSLVWNEWAEEAPWERAFRDVRDRYRGDAPQYVTGRWREAFDDQPWFGPLRHEAFHHVHDVSPAEAVDRVASISYVAALPPAEHARVRAELLEQLPTTDPDARLPLAYRTDVFTTTARGASADGRR